MTFEQKQHEYEQLCQVYPVGSRVAVLVDGILVYGTARTVKERTLRDKRAGLRVCFDDCQPGHIRDGLFNATELDAARKQEAIRGKL